jgi:hypothetical protein
MAASVAHAQGVRIAGVPCASPPAFHCAVVDCSKAVLAQRGNVVLPKSNRAFFLDYPCDLKPDEPVTFIVSLHAAGTFANWHRHYFPLVDLKDRYRLVIATPTAINAVWKPENDDEHLRRIVEFVYREVGATNIRAFWLAGHSDGSQAAYRLLRLGIWRDRVTGWVSLSGGRLGSPRAYWRGDAAASHLLQSPPDSNGSTTPALQAVGVGLTDASVLPDYPFSHLYSSGDHELTDAGLPRDSRWAQRLGCQAQTRRPEVVDAKAGYVASVRSPLTRGPVAGRHARPGRAHIYVYPHCPNGRIVADVIRVDKGHNEGLEPKVTEEIVRLMLSAR